MTTKTKKRASNAKLGPGENSIDRARATKQPDGSYWLRWRLCLPDGRVKAYRSQGKTVTEARARADETARKALESARNAAWGLDDDLPTYIKQVTLPAIEKARTTKGRDLADNSKLRYRAAAGQLRDGFKGHTIGSGTRFRVMESVLQDIAQVHGSESARQARNVLGKYVIQQLIRDEVLGGNPLAGMGIDLGSEKPLPPRPERAMTKDELNSAIDWLLALDPAESLAGPKRGRGGSAAAIAKRRNLIDLALLQACSGLRVGEANALTWDVFDNSANVTKSKTHRGRVVPLLFPDVIEHLAKRRALGGAYVIGSPVDGSKPWDRDHCRKECAKFYPEIGAGIDCHEVFDHGRTHLWRETLNSLMLGVPVEVRAAYFGHDSDTNSRYYTDTTDVTPMLTEAKKLRA